MTGKLTKSSADRLVAGVCGGIAEFYGWDPTWVRLAFVAATLAWGIGIGAYLILMIVMPEPDGDSAPVVADAPAGGTDAPPPAASHGAPVAVGAPVAARPQRRGSGMAFGALLVAFGVALLVSQFVPAYNVWAFWPLIIIVFAVIGVFRARDAVQVFDSLTSVVVGLILLANTLGYLSWGVWLGIISLWPLLLVSLGLAVIARGVGQTWLKVAGQLVIIAGLLYGALLMPSGGTVVPLVTVRPWPGSATPYMESVAHDASVTVGSARIAADAARLGLSAGDDLASIEGLASGSPESLESADPKLSTEVDGSEATVDVSLDRDGPVAGIEGRTLDVKLDREVSWQDVEITTGASDARIDVEDLEVERIGLTTGASMTSLRIGSRSDRVAVQATGGVTVLVLQVPADAAVSVKADGGPSLISAPGFSQAGLGSMGGGYDKPGAGGPTIDVEVTGGIANVTVETY